MQTINDIPVLARIKMKIEFPTAGNAQYSFYTVDSRGKRESVSSTAVKAEVMGYIAQDVAQSVADSIKEQGRQMKENPLTYTLSLVTAGASIAGFMVTGGAYASGF